MTEKDASTYQIAAHFDSYSGSYSHSYFNLILSYRTEAMFEPRYAEQCDRTFVTVTCIHRQAKKTHIACIVTFLLHTFHHVCCMLTETSQHTWRAFFCFSTDMLRLQTYGHIVQGLKHGWAVGSVHNLVFKLQAPHFIQTTWYFQEWFL